MEKVLFILLLLAIFSVGYIAGMILTLIREKPNGTIFLDKNENGDDRIRFCLDMEYDDISKYSKIVFFVKKTT